MLPLTKLPPFFPGQWGVPGSDAPLGIRTLPQSIVLYVDFNHGAANDNNTGTDPDAPLAHIQQAVNNLQHAFDVIIVRSIDPSGENVHTPDYTDTFSYVSLIGAGDTMYSPDWLPRNTNLPNLDLNAVGWVISGFRFEVPLNGCAIELHHTDVSGNDIAIRTIIKNCLFDGLTTGRYGIVSHGCYDVWVVNCVFQLFNNAVAGGAVCLLTGTTPLAIPYRNHIIGNVFWDSNNGAVFPCNGSEIKGNLFQPVGYAYPMTLVLQTSIIANPGDDNVVHGNTFPGDYSIVGGYRGGAADIYIGNLATDVAEAEVGDNGFTILPPA
jgi:hypothetical protein